MIMLKQILSETANRAIGSLLAAIVALPFLGSGAWALAFWDGTIFVSALNGAGCPDTGIAVGDAIPAVFRLRFPANDPTQQNSGILLRAQRGSQFVINGNSQPSDHMQGAGAYTGSVIGERATFKTGNGTYNFTIKPNPVRKTTNFVTINGTLDNVFPNAAGTCEMTFTGMFQRRPQ